MVFDTKCLWGNIFKKLYLRNVNIGLLYKHRTTKKDMGLG